MTPAQARQAEVRAAWLKRTIAEAPPLTQEQIADLRRILGKGRPVLPPTPRVPEPVDERTALYFHYDADDVLLYVGISNDPVKRARTHSRRSFWSRFAVRSESRWYDTKREALDAEAVAIRTELPLFNGTLNDAPDLRQRQVEYLLAHDAYDLLRPDTER